MKRIILILYLLLGVSMIVNAQTYCQVEGTNTSGVVIDSIKFISPPGPTIVLGGTDYSQEVTDSATILSGIAEISLYSSVDTDTVTAKTDSVYWRIYLDEGADGVFDTSDIIYQSPKVPTGLHLANPVIPMYNFSYGTIRQIRVEMVEDTTLFGACSSETFPPNAVYGGADFPGINTGGKLVVKNGSKGRNTINNVNTCSYCLPFNDTLVFYLEDQLGFGGCNIQFDSIFITDGSRTKYGFAYNTSDITLCEIEIFDSSNGSQVITTKIPFDLDDNKSAKITLVYNLNGIQLFPSGEKGQIFIDYTFDNCPPSPRSSHPKSRAPVPELGDYSLCIGCYPDTCVVYDFHASTPNGEDQLPFYTGAFKSITAKDDVTVNTGDSTIFKVDEAGFIKVTSGVKVEPNSFFWAFKGEPCLEPDGQSYSSNFADEIVEMRALDLENSVEIKLFPNPFQEQLVIELSQPTEKDFDVIVSDILGKKIYQAKLSETKRFEINTNHWTSGIYLVQLKIGAAVYTHTMIKAN